MSNSPRPLLLGAALLLSLSAGCGGGAGADGKDGINGSNGANGESGAPGGNGLDGVNGVDGINGVDGVDGETGADGHDGRDGHDGEGPWGINLTLVSIDGGTGSAGAFQVGDFPSVTFTLTDDDGHEYDVSELTGFYFNVAGPTSHYANAILYSDLAKVADTAVYNFDGTWTYDFDIAFPATYHAVLNDTTDLGTDDGDWGGEALVDGTYTVAAWAYSKVTLDDGSYYYEAGNATSDVLFGTATAIEPREVVLEENCANCHGDEFMAHGGSRRDLDVCLTCHVAGSEDRYSSTDSTVTPGTSVGMTTMIHKIHMGEDLSNGYTVAGYPADTSDPGYPNYNSIDFSEVVFPSFKEGSASCDSCHSGAADGDVNTRPTREACGACHDSVDFAAGTNHEGGAQTNDTNCAVCHSPEDIDGYHLDARFDTAFNPGINVEILTASGGSGSGGAFQAGDTVTITFKATHDDGTYVDKTEFAYSSSSSTCGTLAGGATLYLGGPTEHMERIQYSTSPSSSSTVGSVYGSSTYDSSTGIYTYSMPAVIPSTIPAQLNDTTGFGVEQGDWYGLPLPSGTYRLGLALYTTLWDADCNRVRVADTTYFDILMGTATTIEDHDYVDNASCESCHETVEFHGDSRNDVSYCVMCHTPGSEDSSSVNPTTTLDFPVMIHKIHGSSILENGYCVGSTCFDVTFPRFDGGVQACTACHGATDKWENPSTRGCITCHDSEDAAAHAAIMTDDVYGESCDTCHGPGRDYSSETVHAWTR